MPPDNTPGPRYWCVEWHEALDSTMDRAAAVAGCSDGRGRVIVADYQRFGRGTRGRQWIAPPRSCLMFTAILYPELRPHELPDLPAQIGHLVAEVLVERLAIGVRVSPPNDLMLDGRKLCGVLCQSRVVHDRVTHVLCGIGLNTWMSEGDLPVPDATSLFLGGVDVPRHEILLEWLLGALTPLR